MKKVAFYTLGCKVNTYESQAMLKAFIDAGYQEVNFKEIADVYVINTCTVTNTGDSKSRQVIRKAIRLNENATICVVGCYSQVAPEEIQKIEGVDVIIGTQYRGRIVEFVDEYNRTNKKVIRVESVMKKKTFEDLNVTTFKHTRAFLKIQDGCNNFCTYCIIPYARGGVRSRKPESVLDQIKVLVKNGYVEIVLTGIHTAGYGQDFDSYSFYNLLKDITKINGLKRLRISSIEISQITPEIMDLIGKENIVVNHLHVPLQAGCDETLKRMNRKYTTAQYLQQIENIRKQLPSVSFTTDVIVGFPGETDEEFENTYTFIKTVGFTSLHVFPYSKRKNTPAASMKDQVKDDIKSDRVNTLIQLSNELLLTYSKQQIGKTLAVLFEKQVDGYYIGHASNYLEVKVRSKENLIGKIKNVVIEEFQEILQGRVDD